MAGKWCIDNVTALIVDGVRYTLQPFSYRTTTTSAIYTWYLWTKDANQSGGGFKIDAPMLLTDCKWAHWDNYSTAGATQYNEATLYEDTFAHYGTAGMPDYPNPYTPPTDSITVLAPHVNRVPGSLAFDPLGAKGTLVDYSTNTPNISLWINGIQQRIIHVGAHTDPSSGYYQRNWDVYALGQQVQAA